MQLTDAFKSLGVRVRVTRHASGDVPTTRTGRSPADLAVTVDVRDDGFGGGEYFKIGHRADVDVGVLDVANEDGTC